MPLERSTAMTSPTPGGTGAAGRRRPVAVDAVGQAHGDERHAAQGEAGDATERCRGRRIHDTQRTHAAAARSDHAAPGAHTAYRLFTCSVPDH